MEPVYFTSPVIDYRVTRPDPYAGHRLEDWRWVILAFDHAELGTLDGVKNGTLEFSTGNTIRGGGNLEWTGAKKDEPNWDQIYLQPWYSFTAEDGTVHQWPRGVFIPATAPASYSDTARTLDVDLYDKLLILDRDKVLETYAVRAGTNVVTAVRTVIEEAGQTRHSIEDSTETVRTDMVWEPGTSRLRIINDLLESINYFSLWADGYGTYQGLPYKDPQARPTIRAFVNNSQSIYAPDFTHERDTFDTPNRVVAVGRGDDTPEDGSEPEVFVGVAENTDPESPTSYPSRGRWIVHHEEDVEATSQAVIDSIAARRLTELTQTSSVVEFDHAPIPLELNDIIEFTYDDDVKVRATIQSFSMSTEQGALMGTRVREVAT